MEGEEQHCVLSLSLSVSLLPRSSIKNTLTKQHCIHLKYRRLEGCRAMLRAAVMSGIDHLAPSKVRRLVSLGLSPGLSPVLRDI